MIDPLHISCCTELGQRSRDVFSLYRDSEGNFVMLATSGSPASPRAPVTMSIFIDRSSLAELAVHALKLLGKP